MVDYTQAGLDQVFSALSDPTRRGMLDSLSFGERSISELARPLDMSLEAASKHVKVLERAGLVERSKRGRTHYCRIDPRPLAQAHEWLNAYRKMWSQQFDKLDAYLARRRKERESDD